MAETREFKPVKEFGSIPLSEESELRFYVDEYRGYTYASIRTFLKRSGYSGPTKSGVTLNKAMIENALGVLSKLPPDFQAPGDQELARFQRKAGLELVLRVTVYKESVGIDVREWVDDISYKGWSKKGVRIPYADLPKALEYLRQMRDFLQK